MIRRPPRSTLFPTRRSSDLMQQQVGLARLLERGTERGDQMMRQLADEPHRIGHPEADRKSTRLNSSHSQISYAVFCLKKKNQGRLLGFAQVTHDITGLTHAE